MSGQALREAIDALKDARRENGQAGIIAAGVHRREGGFDLELVIDHATAYETAMIADRLLAKAVEAMLPDANTEGGAARIKRIEAARAILGLADRYAAGPARSN